MFLFFTSRLKRQLAQATRELWASKTTTLTEDLWRRGVNHLFRHPEHSCGGTELFYL